MMMMMMIIIIIMMPTDLCAGCAVEGAVDLACVEDPGVVPQLVRLHQAPRVEHALAPADDRPTWDGRRQSC
jgi:hypothetical protein